AAGTVDDAFRHTGRARGVEDVERVVEPDRLEGDFLRLEGLDEVVERGAGRRRLAEIVDHHAFVDAGQPIGHLGGFRLAVEFRAVVDVAIGAEQYLRLDLPKAIEDALYAEVRRAA